MRIAALLFAIAMAGLGACRTPYYPARFAPGPARTVVRLPQAERGDTTDGAEAEVSARVRGVRRADSKSGTAAQVEVEMRIENTGRVPLRLEQQSLELRSGGLRSFGDARIESDDPPRVQSGGATDLSLFFPLPAGKSVEQVDFRSLTLTWTLVFDGDRATTSTTFQRVWRQPYRDSPYGLFYYGSGWYGSGWIHAGGWCPPGVSIGVGYGVWP